MNPFQAQIAAILRFSRGTNRILYPPAEWLLPKGDELKSDFDKNLAILKGLEERAKKTRNEMDKFMAERMRDNMMSYRGMTSQVLLAACSKSPEVRRHVLDLMKRREVEEMHRLWVKYCKKK